MSAKSLAMLTSMALIGTILGADDNVRQHRPMEDKKDKPKDPVHPFAGVDEKLFSFLLDDPTINYQNVIDLKEFLFVPVQLIPLDKAMDIIRYVQNNNKKMLKNLNVFEADIQLFDTIYTVKVVATNRKNANLKMLRKVNTINDLK